MCIKPVKLPFDGLEIYQNIGSQAVSSDTQLLFDTISECYLSSNSGIEQCVLELGTGCGILAIMLHHQFKKLSITAIEAQIQMYLLAKRNITQSNSMIDLRLADLRSFHKSFGNNKFDLICANPPFYPINRVRVSPNIAKALSRYELLSNLEDIVEAIAHNLRVDSEAKAFILYPATRTEELIISCAKRDLVIEKVDINNRESTAKGDNIRVFSLKWA